MADVDDCGIRRMFLGYSLAAPAPWLSMATKRPSEKPTSDLSRPVRHVTAPADGAFEAAAPGAKATNVDSCDCAAAAAAASGAEQKMLKKLKKSRQKPRKVGERRSGIMEDGGRKAL